MSKRRSVSRNTQNRAEHPRSVPRRSLPRVLSLPAPLRLYPIQPAELPVRAPRRFTPRPFPRPQIKLAKSIQAPVRHGQIKQVLASLNFHPASNPCRDRDKRREVLFAMNKAGYSGSAAKRHYRRTIESQYSC